jgi:hypothetical protein
MEPEIRPDPSPQERAAILAGLNRLLTADPHRAFRSAWREEGIRENLEAELEWDQPVPAG